MQVSEDARRSILVLTEADQGNLGGLVAFRHRFLVARRGAGTAAAGTVSGRILRFGRSVLRSLSPSGLRSEATPPPRRCRRLASWHDRCAAAYRGGNSLEEFP